MAFTCQYLQFLTDIKTEVTKINRSRSIPIRCGAARIKVDNCFVKKKHFRLKALNNQGFYVYLIHNAYTRLKQDNTKSQLNFGIMKGHLRSFSLFPQSMCDTTIHFLSCSNNVFTFSQASPCLFSPLSKFTMPPSNTSLNHCIITVFGTNSNGVQLE